jgi:hypothetical protein
MAVYEGLMKFYLIVGVAVFLTSCAEYRIKRYQHLLDTHVGSSPKPTLDKLLGEPASCRPDGNLKLCEYRTSAGRNEQVPYVHQKKQGFPDLSPYEHYDVLHLFYDDFDVLREWRPVVLPHPQ